MTYIIARKPSGDNTIYHADDRAEADQIVQTILDEIRGIINPELLKITRKEDDVLIKWEGKLLSTIEVREDDEVDVKDLNSNG